MKNRFLRVDGSAREYYKRKTALFAEDLTSLANRAFSFLGIYGRFEGFSGRFKGICGRFKSFSGRFAGICGRFRSFSGRFEGLFGRFMWQTCYILITKSPKKPISGFSGLPVTDTLSSKTL